MVFMMTMFLFGLILAMAAVASNPSPYFAALGMVVAAGMGCGVLVVSGGPFLSALLFLIYLGGMLVVFAYTAALAAEPYPEAWGNWPVLGAVGCLLGGTALVGGLSWNGWAEGPWLFSEDFGEFSTMRGDVGGVAVMYSFGGGLLIVSTWALLLVLFVVLELVRGLDQGPLRAV